MALSLPGSASVHANSIAGYDYVVLDTATSGEQR